MGDFFLVGIGGALGGLTRFSIGKLLTFRMNRDFPVGTFLINVSGAFLLGFLAVLPVSRCLYLFFGDGFLGAYTTFSTFMYDGFTLIRGKRMLNASAYIFLTFALGILFFLAGSEVGRICIKT